MKQNSQYTFELYVDFYLEYIRLEGVYKGEEGSYKVYTYCTMNIFGSKSGHYYNNSKNCKIFFIFPKFLLYLIIFPSTCATLYFEKSSNTANNLLKKI